MATSADRCDILSACRWLQIIRKPVHRSTAAVVIHVVFLLRVLDLFSTDCGTNDSLRMIANCGDLFFLLLLTTLCVYSAPLCTEA